jgi:hypothetical protein
MDLGKLNDWMQVIGIFAVVASLIFVGIELKQSQEIAVAAQYQARAATAVEVHEGRMQNEIVSRRVGEDLKESFGLPRGFDESMTAREFGVLVSDARKILIMYDNLHFQYEAGFLSEDSWMGHRSAIRDLLGRSMYRYMIEISGKNSRRSFIELLSQLERENQAEDQ